MQGVDIGGDGRRDGGNRCMVCGGCVLLWLGKVDVPEAVEGITGADSVGAAIFGELHSGGGENGMVAVVAELANGQEWVARETGEHMGTAGRQGQWWKC